MKLYDYYRSTASYRVRIALNIKEIDYDTIPVHLINHGGEQHAPEYLSLNPQGLVPTLIDGETVLSQSLAIIDYLEDIKPTPALFPEPIQARSQVKQIALIIACDMHPLNNLRVLNYLKQHFFVNESQLNDWYHHWLKQGFDAIENQLKKLPREKDVCYGNQISLADVCLIPQVYNAKRYQFSMDGYPLISKINNYCLKIPAFYIATPESS